MLHDSVARLQMTGIPDLGIRVDIMGQVLDPLLCVFLADIQSVGIGACMHVCVWYTELTCISNGVSKTDIVVGKVQCVCVCVDRWRGHSRCRAPLTTGVDISLPQGPTICILCASGRATPFAGRP